MELTVGQITEMKEPLQRLIQEKLPMKVAFKLSKLIKIFDENLKYLEETRVKLVQELGELDEQGNTRVPQDKLPDFHKQYVDLLNEKVNVDVEPIKIADVSDVQISTQDIMRLQAILEE